MVDWGFAIRTGIIGMLLVFVILIILAVIIWLVGLIFRNRTTKQPDLKKDNKV